MKIAATGLGKRFNREWIFRNFDYQFESGSTYAIIGPNGSGKSTLLQVLWGQVPQSAGAIKYYHDNGSEIPGEEVFASLAIATPYMELVEEFTVREMVAFHFRFKTVRGRFSYGELFAKFHLDNAADKRISELSSGMRQRLKLGLAMFADTPILFLDEPTTNLDRNATDWYLTNLKQLPGETMVFIASNQEHEYPESAKKINISVYKTVTTA